MGNKHPKVLVMENKFPSMSLSPRAKITKKENAFRPKKSKLNLKQLCIKVTPLLINKLSKSLYADLTVALRFVDSQSDFSTVQLSRSLNVSMASSTYSKPKARKILLNGDKFYKNGNKKGPSSTSSKYEMRKDYGGKIPKPRKGKSNNKDLLDLSRDISHSDNSFLSDRPKKRLAVPDVSYDTESYVSLYKKRLKKEGEIKRDTPNFNKLISPHIVEERIFEDEFAIGTEDRFSFSNKQESEGTFRSSKIFIDQNSMLTIKNEEIKADTESIHLETEPIYRRRKPKP